jgi:hypothetical protein
LYLEFQLKSKDSLFLIFCVKDEELDTLRSGDRTEQIGVAAHHFIYFVKSVLKLGIALRMQVSVSSEISDWSVQY